MPQPVSNTTDIVSGSLLANKISYVVDGQNRNYRGGFGGLSWMSEAPSSNNVIFIGNTTTIGRGPADKPLFYPSFNNTEANIVYAVNTLPGSPGNLTTLAGAYNWATTNNFFINNSDNPIARVNADGLVLYVDASQPTSYPQTGTSWYDLSGYGNTGTLTNGPTWNSNGWFDFDGVDDYIDCGSGMSATGKVTVSALVNLDTFSNPGGSSHIVDSNSNSWHLAVLTNGVPYFWNGTTYHTTGTPLSTGRWYMLTGVQGTTLDIYVNGELNNSLNSNLNIATDNVWIGAWALGSRFLNGQVSNTQIYPRALSQTEIKQNYFQSNIVTDGLVLMVDANNLVSYPKSGTTAYPLTSSINGTLINGTSFNSSYGGYWAFDGVDDYISWGDNFDLTSTSISGFVWGWANSLNNYLPWIDKLSGNGNYRFHADSTGGLIFGIRNTANAYEQMQTGILISPNTWYHLGFTFNNSTREGKIYVNGQVQLSYTFTIDRGDTTTNLQTGYQANNGGTLNGRIASLSLYNKTLTSDEVQQNYQATKDKFLGSNIVTNGLLVYLDAADKDSYPGTGTTWTDLSGNGNNGTLTNGPVFLPSVGGGVFDLDGVDDYVSLGSGAASIVQGRTALTIGIMFNMDATGTLRGLIGTLNYFCGGNLGLVASNDALEFYNDTATCYSIGLSSYVTTGKWIYAVGTYDGTTTRLYGIKDGTLTQTSGTGKSGNTNVFSSDFRVMGNQNPTIFTNGKGSVAFAYNRVLSETEIVQNYDAIKLRFGL
jgi:hypothetical protein